MLNKKQKEEMIGLLNVHYGYITTHSNEQAIYYRGMLTAFDSMLAREHKTVCRKENGLHEIVEERY